MCLFLGYAVVGGRAGRLSLQGCSCLPSRMAVLLICVTNAAPNGNKVTTQGKPEHYKKGKMLGAQEKKNVHFTNTKTHSKRLNELPKFT